MTSLFSGCMLTLLGPSREPARTHRPLLLEQRRSGGFWVPPAIPTNSLHRICKHSEQVSLPASRRAYVFRETDGISCMQAANFARNSILIACGCVTETLSQFVSGFVFFFLSFLFLSIFRNFFSGTDVRCTASYAPVSANRRARECWKVTQFRTSISMQPYTVGA